MNHIKQLDGLRGLTILMVMVAHFPMIYGATIANKLLFVGKKGGFGYIGVEVFFIISGYLITKILASSINKNETNTLSTFYMKRILRLSPVLIIVISGCLVFMPQYNYLHQILFTSNYYFAFNADDHPLRHLWSLAVEEQFYLFWPLALLFIRPTNGGIKFFLIGLASISTGVIIVRGISGTQLDQNLIYRSLETRMLSLIVGSALAIYGIPLIKSWKLWLAGFSSLAIAAIAITLDKAGHNVGISIIKAFTFLIFATCIFLIAFDTGGLFSRLLRTPPMMYLGKISYGLYIYHLPILFYFGISHMQIREGNYAKLNDVLQSAGVIAAVTLISWYIIEQPILKIKDNLLNHKLAHTLKYHS